jgi:hypothetical protein
MVIACIIFQKALPVPWLCGAASYSLTGMPTIPCRLDGVTGPIINFLLDLAAAWRASV